MHSQKRREISEDSTSFSISGVPHPILSTAVEAGASANTNEGSVDEDAAVVEQGVVEQHKELEAETSEEVVDLAPNEELGRYLRLEREANKISIGDIAKITKIPKTSLEALEEGRFSDLPGDVFVRGFLRSYARCLKVDGDEVIRRYVQCGLCPAPVSSDMADSLLTPNRRPANRRRTRSFTSAPGQNSEADTQISSQEGPEASSQTGTRGAKKIVAKDAASDNASRTAENSSRKSVKKVLKDAFDLARSSDSKTNSTTRIKGKAAAKSKTGHTIEVVDMSSDASSDASSDSSAIKLVEAPAEEKLVRIFVPPVLNFGEERTSRGPLTLGVIILVIVATLTMSYLLRRPGVSTEGFTQLGDTTPVQELLASRESGLSDPHQG